MHPQANDLPVVSQPGTDEFRIIAGDTAFGSRMLVVEIVIRAGGEPPLRRHRNEDLLMFVLDGRLTLHLDGELHPASPGTCLVVPKGCAHGFVVESESARLLIVVAPAGAEELLVQLFDAPGAQGKPASDDGSCEGIDHLVTMAARYGVEITGPPPGLA